MEIVKTTQTKIVISEQEIKDIIINYLGDKGYDVNSYESIIKTVYDGTMNDLGTDEFAGVVVYVNKDVITIK